MNLKIFALTLFLFLGISNIHATENAESANIVDTNSILQNEQVSDDNYSPGIINYETVAFKNKCYKPIAVFVHYLNLNNSWITNGYYRLTPYQKRSIFYTRNTIFYYYAQSMDGTLVWKGEYGFRFKDVIIPMRKVEMSINDWGVYTMTLTCN